MVHCYTKRLKYDAHNEKRVRGCIKNIHLYIFRNLNFVFSVLICDPAVFCILVLGSG